jgi:hypothetical protein
MEEFTRPQLHPGFIAHNRESGAYTLTDSGRATLTAIHESAP